MEYWHERFEELEEDKNEAAELFAAMLLVLFGDSIRNIKTRLSSWFGTYGDISTTEARKPLTPMERKEFQVSVKKYMNDDVDAKWLVTLERFASKVRVSRLDALEVQVLHEIEKLFGRYGRDFDGYLIDLFVDQHDHVLFELSKGTGRSAMFNKVDMTKLRKLLGDSWAVDGKVYSTRIWDNKLKLSNEIKNVIERGLIRGDSCGDMTEEIVKRLNVSYSNAERLVKTESAFIASEAEREAYKKFDVKRYEYCAILDSRTSEVCRYMDGKVFLVSEMKVGLNAPPLHCNCRSTTCPYFDEDDATKDGIVDTKLTFEQWQQMFLK